MDALDVPFDPHLDRIAEAQGWVERATECKTPGPYWECVGMAQTHALIAVAETLCVVIHALEDIATLRGAD